MSAKRQGVHVRVNDAFGNPTPVRVRFTDEAGTYFAPLGRLTQFSRERGIDVGGNTSIDGAAWAYADGAFEILLPPGPIRVQVAKGPEHQAIDEEFIIQPGRLSIRLTIRRTIDMRVEGWHSGDAASYFLAPHAALLEAACEDLAVLNLLIAEDTIGGAPSLANMCAFSGQESAIESHDHLIAVNTLNDSNLGRLLLLHSHRAVYPMSFDVAGDSWILEDWCDQCHRKSGLVVADDYVDRAGRDDPDETLAEIVRGKIDAVRIRGPQDYAAWYDLLNAGIRIPAIAGSDKDRNVGAVGSSRTYAWIGPEAVLEYRGWIEAVRAGRSFVTNGPMLRAAFLGEPPGTSFSDETLRRGFRSEANVGSFRRIRFVEIVTNGIVTERIEVESKAFVEQGEIPCGGWQAMRCVSEDGTQWAHTSPVYFAGPEPEHAAEARGRLRGRVERTLSWARQAGHIADDRRREHLIAVLIEAKNALHA